MEILAVPLILAVILAFVAFNSLLKFKRETEHRQMLFDTQKHLLDKLGSAAEVSQFLSSPEGKEFVDRLKPPQPFQKPAPKQPNPFEVMILMIWAGMILIGVGVGLLIGAALVERRLVIIGSVVSLAGLGMLIGLRITHSLATRWGIFKRPDISQGSRAS